MTIEHFIQQNTRKLDSSGVGTARLDVMVLLEDCLNKNRTHLLAHPELELTNEQLKWLSQRISRRNKHEPLAYIRGKTEFYGREFIINKNVLEPRPESETMIDLLKSSFKGEVKELDFRLRGNDTGTPAIIDVGTGSGALAITAKLVISSSNVIGIDIDPKCITVASKNAEKFAVKVAFIQGDLLEPLTARYKKLPASVFILANLPYVPDNFHINEAAEAEPRIAIFGGHDGLDLYRRMFKQIQSLKIKPKFVFTESMPPQHAKLATIAQSSGYTLAKTDDFIQVFTSV